MSFDLLDDIPVELAEDGLPANPAEWLDSIPTAPVLSNLLMDYPASFSDADGVPLSTRVPAHWIEQIDELRQMPGTNLPDFFKRRATFVRWAVFIGMQTLHKISAEMNAEGRLDHQLDPTLRARIFLEKQGGQVAARAEAMNEAKAKVKEIAEAVAQLVEMSELAEAANLINGWLEGARDQDSPFWSHFFCKLLVSDPMMRDQLQTLIDHSQITDEYLIALYQRYANPSESDDPDLTAGLDQAS